MPLPDYNLLIELLFNDIRVKGIRIERGMIDQSIVAGIYFKRADQDQSVDFLANDFAYLRGGKEELTKRIAERLLSWLD